MNCPDYNSPSALKSFMETRGLSMQKRFGQNFLVNGHARKKLIDALSVREGTSVWEVGPGLGAMTKELLLRGARLTVFEIDVGFSAALRDIFSDCVRDGRLRIVEGDALKTWKAELKESGEPERFFGNLPYNCAAAILAGTIESGVRFERAVVTLQREVAARMTAVPSAADYSSFSILSQWAYEIAPLADLSGGSFWPRPNVESRAVVLSRKADFPLCRNPRLFVRLQRALFSSRRKTVRNNLARFLPDAETARAALERAGIDPSARAETLPLSEILRLSDILNADIIGVK